MKFKLLLLSIALMCTFSACSSEKSEENTSSSTQSVQTTSISESESKSLASSTSVPASTSSLESDSSQTGTGDDSDCVECKDAQTNPVSPPAISGPEDVSYEKFKNTYPLTSEDGTVIVEANNFNSNLWENPENVKEDSEYFVNMWRYQLFPDAQGKIEQILGNYYSDNSIMQYDAYLNQYLFSMQLVSDPLGYAGAYSSGGKGVTAYWVFNPEDRDNIVSILDKYDAFLQENFYKNSESELESLAKSKAFYSIQGDRAIYVLPFMLKNISDADKEYTLDEYAESMDSYVKSLCDELGFPYPEYLNTESTLESESESLPESESLSESDSLPESESESSSKP